MSKKQRKGGFSIAEVVMALAIIVSVTATAMSIALKSVNTTANVINLNKAQDFAENAWECFKAAGDEIEFISLLEFAQGVELNRDSTDANGNSVYKHIIDEERYTVKITVGFHDEEDVADEFNVAVINKNEKNILSFSYQKGDGR